MKDFQLDLWRSYSWIYEGFTVNAFSYCKYEQTWPDSISAKSA